MNSLPKETEWIEFKTNNSQDIGEYISALSNSACIHDENFGYLVFGIADQSHEIVGTTFSPFQKGKGNEDLIPWISRLLEPRIHFEHFQIEVQGKSVVVFRIRASVNTPVKFSGEAYVRVGSYKKKLKDFPEKGRIIWTKEPTYSFERGIASFHVSGDRVLQLIDYAAYFDMIGSPLPDNRSQIFDRLVQESILVETGSNYDITNLGAILFAKKITTFENLARKAIRIVIYHGKNKLKTRKEFEGSKGYASGFQQMIDYILDQLSVNEEIGSAVRNL
ncbi:MAG: putative DNA binding domain-containing protein [Bacteroidales bacterium]